MTTHSI